MSLAIKRRPPPEILPRTVNPLFKTERQGAWTLKKSMFEGYRQETPNLLTKAFESDWTKCAVRGARLRMLSGASVCVLLCLKDGD